MNKTQSKTIDNPKKRNFSKRASTSVIDIVKRFCNNCGHHKAFSKPSGLFCCKCRERLR